MQCLTSTLHAHDSGLKHWLIDPKTKVIKPEMVPTDIFLDQNFLDGFARHDAGAWALLALCAQRASGHLVDRDTLAAWRTQFKVVGPVETPRLTLAANGPILRFWSYTTYRSLPTVYMHRIYVDENKKLVNDESKGERLVRLQGDPNSKGLP